MIKCIWCWRKASTNIVINRTVLVVSVISRQPLTVLLVFILRITFGIHIEDNDEDTGGNVDYNTNNDNCRYAQAGTPEVTLSTSYDQGSKTFTVTAEQVTQPTPGQDTKYPVLIPIKVALFGKSGQALPLKLQVCPLQILCVYECICIYAYTYFYTHIKICRNSFSSASHIYGLEEIYCMMTFLSLADLWPWIYILHTVFPQRIQICWVREVFKSSLYDSCAICDWQYCHKN